MSESTIHIDIACAADDNYATHAAVMLFSLRQKNPRAQFTVHFLHGPSLGETNKRKLSRHLKSLHMSPNWVFIADNLVDNLPTQGYLSKVVWYRVLMPNLLPDLAKVLFLDCDLLINQELTELWETPLANNFFAAVTNIIEERFSGRAAALGLPGPQEYFNAGVGVWNLQAMRAEEFTQQVIEYALAHSKQLLWLEQDAINALFYQRRLAVHPKWNVQNGMFYRAWGCSFLDQNQLEEALTNPAIIHFEGGEAGKPWHLLCTHPHKKSYYKYRRKTPWPLTKPDGINPRNLVLKFAPEKLIDQLKRIKRQIISIKH